jgi:N-acetylglucosamine-6-phosphate deacetylase
VPSPQNDTVFLHARKLDAHGEVDDFWMLVEGDTIVATGTGSAPTAANRVDVGGHWLVPGFIDLHCHGGGGHAFDGNLADITSALEVHRQHGTTRALISLVANPLAALRDSLSAVADLAQLDPLVLGSHLEGPFLDREHRGEHNGDYLREPQPSVVDDLLQSARGTLRQLTVAPELPNAMEAIDILVEAGVVVSIGHTAADYETAKAAFDRGARLLTHAFNAMPGIHHRAPGPVVAALEDERVTLELVLDGLHVHPRVASLLFLSAPGRIALVTDAMAAAGSTDGDYQLGAMAVTVANGHAVLRGTQTIVGSTLTIDAAIRCAVEQAGIGLREAVEAATLTPARVLGLERRHGLLAPGFVADAVVLDHALSVTDVWGAGARLR